MMTLRAVHSGMGFRYLLRSVATNDADAGVDTKLSDYYAAKGTPPGRWRGSGLSGLSSTTVHDGAVVSELQMAALYGEGLHPDADEMLLAGVEWEQVKLGRAFPTFTDKTPVLAALAKAEKEFRLAHKRLPNDAERSEMAVAIGRPFFVKETGKSGVNGAEVVGWVNAQRDKVKQAVAGFDLTFSPTKSVSVLWALADEETASKIAALHHEAVSSALRWAEENAVYTRTGVNGIKQEKTHGIVATEFTHFDTRAGDPDLHSHVLVSNKVCTLSDNKWRTLDSRMMFHLAQSISARYDVALQDLLNREMGIEFRPRSVGSDKEPVWEVAGVDDRLIKAFSSRREMAQPVFEQMVSEYHERYGKSPSKRVVYELWQQAILDTRDAKKPAVSLAELRQNWAEQARDVVGENGIKESVAAALSAAQKDAQRDLFSEEHHAEDVAKRALDAVKSRRAQWRESHMQTAVATQLKAFRFSDEYHREHAHSVCLKHAINATLSVTPAEPLDLPTQLVTDNGQGIDRRANSAKFTTNDVLSAEQSVVAASDEIAPVFATNESFNSACKSFEDDNGFALNDAQRRMAHHFVTSGRLVAAGVGPAGTGKTASMKLVADTWRANGRSVIGVSTSAAAAEGLGEEIGETGHTIASLAFVWRGQHPTLPAKDPAALPVLIRPGDMILVDEAGMVGTENLATVVEIARATGAVVRLVGDPLQLDAVETGGLFRDIVRHTNAPELDTVVRMGKDTEQSQATLALREGDASGLDLYSQRGWLASGSREAMLRGAAEAFIADTEAGKRSLLIATTNSDCSTLNELVRAHRIAHGDTDTAVELTNRRGERVGRGDQIICRKNSQFTDKDSCATPGRVTNGDVYTVTGIGDDGGLEVVDDNGAYRRLPAQYVHDHVQLGYACTVHRAQGATVDTCHAVADRSMDRAGLYVALTRGKEENKAWAITDLDLDTGAEGGHMHSAGDEEAPTAEQLLAGIISLDRSQRSATTTLREETDAATSVKRVRALYLHGHQLAADAFIEAHLPEAIDQLAPSIAAKLDAPEAYDTVRRAWRDALSHGHDPRTTWSADTSSIDDALDTGDLVSWRIRQHFNSTGAEVPVAPPVWAGADLELHDWLNDTARRLAKPKSSADDRDRVARLKSRLATRRQHIASLTSERSIAVAAVEAATKRPAETKAKAADKKLMQQARAIAKAERARKAGASPAELAALQRGLPPRNQWQSVVNQAVDTDSRKGALEAARTADDDALSKAQGRLDQIDQRLDTDRRVIADTRAKLSGLTDNTVAAPSQQRTPDDAQSLISLSSPRSLADQLNSDHAPRAPELSPDNDSGLDGNDHGAVL